MPEEKKYKQFSAADIERYYNGSMSMQEMHALEKAAMEDPFLADALEGYSFTATPVKDVAALKEKINERVNKEKKRRSVIYLPAFRIAAMLVLLLGAGWIAYKVANIDRSPMAIEAPEINVPQQKTNEISTDSSSEDLKTTDSSTENLSTSTAAVSETANNNQTATASKIKQETAQNDVVQHNKKEVATVGEGSENKYKPALINANDDSLLSRETRADVAAATGARRSAAPVQLQSGSVVKGRVVDAKNNAVPFATVINNKNNIVSTTDRDGYFVLPATDSITEITINSVGYLANKSLLPANTINNKVVLKEAQNSLSEVVVTQGYATRKKDTSRTMKISVQDAEPAEGWNYFNDYVANLEIPEDINTGKKGEVRLSFDVSPEGEAVNIKVEKSLCEKCDEEAVRALKNGPKWKKEKKKKRAKAKIRF